MIYRNLNLEEAVSTLRTLQDKKIDRVASPDHLEMMLDQFGITLPKKDPGDLWNPTIWATPNNHMHRQISAKMDIPWRYYEKMLGSEKDLLSENVNTWLKKRETNFLVRMYQHEDTVEGRALLSDRFKTIENLDILFIVLQCIRDANMAGLKLVNLDLSETRMFAKFQNVDAFTDGRGFMKNYQNPVTGDRNNAVTSGFAVTNCEVGGYKFKVQPMVTANCCFNQLILQEGAFERVHLGGKMDVGSIDWSKDTLKKNLELIRAQIRDYVIEFSSKRYLESVVQKYSEEAEKPLVHPVNAMANVSDALGVSQKEQEDLMNYFTKSGSMTRGGVVQAVTFHAHEVEDPDKRYELENSAIPILLNMSKYDVSKLN